MAKFKINFKPSQITGHEGSIYCRITHKSEVRHFGMKLKIRPSEWDNKVGKVIISEQISPMRRLYLTNVSDKIKEYRSRLHDIIMTLEVNGDPYTVDDVIEGLKSSSKEGLISYTRRLIDKLKKAQVPVADKYLSALNKFIKFHGTQEIPFSDITPTMMIEFESWMRQSVKRNTSSFYMRSLHAIYNRAVDDGLVQPGNNPFHRVYTSVDKTQKRALQPEWIKKIKDHDLSVNPKMAFARDIFMLSFMLQGMSFVDMAYLKKDDIKDGYLTYKRKKTSQPIIIKWRSEMNRIVKKYTSSCSGNYLLPILSNTEYEMTRTEYRNACRKVNRQLVRLGEKLSLPIKLTTYVARHSWASTALANRVSVSVISRCLGHESERTTKIYLAEFNTFELDFANEAVLKVLF